MTGKTFNRRWGRGALAALILAIPILAIEAGAALAADPFEARSVRWEEDYAWMAKAPPPGALGERLKFVPLAEDRSAWLSLGGELRQREDLIRDSQVGLSAHPDYDTAMTRVYLHADARLGPALRVFGQLSWADEGGRRGADRSFDESGIDVQQLFVDLTAPSGVRLRLGRQELPLGDQRLSEVRETYDLRRSFDAVRLDAPLPADGTLTAFSARPVLNHPGALDDRDQPGETFQGLWAAWPRAAFGGGLDLLWLERRRAASVFTEGTAKERRETFGLRAHGVRGAFDYNLYALTQVGRFGPADIRAWAASADLGWTVRDLAWEPRLSLRADVASGDGRKGDGEMGSFDAPYPNTSYLSTNSAYWPGNAWSLFPLVTLKPSPEMTLFLGAQTMSRMSKADGFYYSPQSPLALPTGHGQVMMRQVYGRVRYEPRRDWVLTATVIRQFAGDPVLARGGRDSSIVSLAVGWKF